MGSWQNTLEPQKPGNCPGSGTEIIQRQRVTKERVVHRVCGWTVQNEMRDVLRRMTAGAAARILDFANPREIRA